MSSRNYHNGLAAEDIAERAYLARDAVCLAKRYRSEAGEIDLILREGPVVVFAEVKARRNHAAAAHSISQKQWQRIALSAQIYMDENAIAATTDLRFDAVLIDATGHAEIVENAAQFD